MIWLIGHKGMLGREIARTLSDRNIAWLGTGRDVDITNMSTLENFAASHDSSAGRTGLTASTKTVPGKITWVINCAGYTPVDKAETDHAAAKKCNEDGARNIARITRSIGARLIHISTDYVFDGINRTEPYGDDDEKHPLNIYGKTKSDGEDAIKKTMAQYYILRTAWLYGFEGKNFVYTMTHAMNTQDMVRVVDDQTGSPTSASDVAAIVLKIILTAAAAHSLFGKNSAIPYGIYNCTSKGSVTWYGFAKKIYELGKKHRRIEHTCNVSPCTSTDWPSPARRPAYSVLSVQKLESALKTKIPHWEESLEQFIKSERFNSETL